MKIIKKLKVGIAFAMLAAMVFTTTVNAATSYTQRGKYADDTSFYHPKNDQDKLNALKKCQLNNYSEVFATYDDEYLQNYAIMYIYNKKLQVYDLKKMADTLNVGMESRRGYFFNQGGFATDNPINPKQKHFFCKCSQYDFEQFVKITVDSSWAHTYNKNTQITKYDKTYPTNRYSIVYDAKKELLIASNVS